MEKLLTVIIPVIRPDTLDRCLETLYRYTDNIFYTIIVDQTKYGIDMGLRDKYPNLMILRSPKTDAHHTGNLGFQLASNLGVQLARTPYVMFLNDDVEFIHPAWWDGVMETFVKVTDATRPKYIDEEGVEHFKLDKNGYKLPSKRPPLLVNLASTKLPDWSVGLPKGQHHYIIPYKENYTNQDWDFLVNQEHYVNEHLTITPGSVIDGINLYASVIDREKLLQVGLPDEYFFPGSAGDYDLSCLASMWGYRCVSTTLAWVFHHWSVSFQATQDEDDVMSLKIPELHHEDLRDKWGDRFDLWGVVCPQCKTIMHTTDGVIATCPKHPQEVFNIPPNSYPPL